MRVALVHDWYVTYAGAERVVEQILKIFPEADLFGVVDFLPEDKREFILNKPVKTTFIQNLPKAGTAYRSYLPLMPIAVEQLDVSGYDLVISSSHAVAKGILTGPDQLHICYCHSPIRYAWDMQHQYLQQAGASKGLKSSVMRAVLHYMRMWDLRTANGVDHFIANSAFIARRIKKIYNREAAVIYPPVAVDDFALRADKEDFYLTASRMVPYKRIDLIVESFAQMPDKKLVVIGGGPDFARIQKKATPNITMMGYQPFDALCDHMGRAKAFVFAAEEDFGIVPVEAQACGTPVIAYGKGGTLETVNADGCEPTGIFFREQSVGSLVEAVESFESMEGSFMPSICRQNAEKFNVGVFRESFRNFVLEKLR